MSFQFASRLKDELKNIDWDLIVIDEAHKLRNLYKPGNKIANNLYESLKDFKKILLTATPLQNSLLELYSLATLIDDKIFASVESFKAKYILCKPNLLELQSRVKNHIHRTLRRQVLEYIQYTKREAITCPFTPTKKEQSLYDLVSEFLNIRDSYAIPWAQRKLILLVIRKLLASSSYALIGTLQTIKARLEDIKSLGKEKDFDIKKSIDDNELTADYIDYDNEISSNSTPKHKGKVIDFAKLDYEISQIDSFIKIARDIKIESKAKELLKALKIGFKRMKELKASKKALIFTESYRTQKYLKNFLIEKGYEGKIVTFNGQNNDELSRKIYKDWVSDNQKSGKVTGNISVDMRTALVDYFKNTAEIMIATEAAAEGINLQFCSMIINYDLPWNPQRVEQRIGRCHRYGQKYDVVVINFLNKNNWADQRIYELLKEKFKIFDGVFGASDEILGKLESGVDFETRIFDIFNNCRDKQEIETAFHDLQTELAEPIAEKMEKTKKLLFENLDEEVHKKFKLHTTDTDTRLDDITEKSWKLVKSVYKDLYYFNDEKLIFGMNEEFVNKGERPTSHQDVPIYYYLDSKPEEEIDKEKLQIYTPPKRRRDGRIKAPIDGYPFRVSNFEGEMAIKMAKEIEVKNAFLTFDLSKYPHKISLLEEYQGKSGWLRLTKLTIKTFDEIEYLIFTIIDENGKILNHEIGEKLFRLDITTEDDYQDSKYDEIIESDLSKQKEKLLQETQVKNHEYFNNELDKIEEWAEDLKNGLELEIKQLDREIKEIGKKSKQMIALKDKLEFQREKSKLEKERNKKRHELFNSSDEIDKKRDRLIEQMEKQLGNHDLIEKEIFRIQWKII